jgi:hypothetical protein
VNHRMAILMAWVTVVLVAYYVIHKPFVPANVLAVGEALAGLVGAGLVVAAGTGIGLVLLRRLDLAPAERIVWAAAIGLGMVSSVGLALGAAGLLRPWLLWLLTAVGLAATGRRLWRVLQASWVDPSWRPRDRFERLLAACCGLALAVALAWALAPPVAWDALVYHLTGPKLYLAAGRIDHSLDVPYLGFPQLVEMLFAWGMGLGGERAAAAIHWFCGVLAALSLVTAGRRSPGGAAGWLAAAVLLSAPSIVLLAGWPYVDLALLLYATLAFLSLARFCEAGSRSRRWLVLSGVFIGLALSTKYTALALLPASGLSLLAARILNSESRTHIPQFSVRDLLLPCGVALVTWSPWLLKNFLLTGNPTYPFFFGGIYWDDWRAWWYDRPGTGLAASAAWKLLTAPWDATVWGVEGAAGYSATIGPLYLALLPLLFLVWRRLPPARRRWLGAALVFCGVLYGFWLWGVARTALLIQARLLFPAFGLLALMVGAAVEGLQALPHRPINAGWIVQAVVLLVLLLGLVETGLGWVDEGTQRVLLGFERREEYLTRRLGWYYPAMQAVNALPRESTVMFLWEPRTYHCTADCLPDALLDRWLHATHVYGHDAQAIADAWRAEGVTHVLLYRVGYEIIVEAGFDPVTGVDVTALERLIRGELDLVQGMGDVYELYALRP